MERSEKTVARRASWPWLGSHRLTGGILIGVWLLLSPAVQAARVALVIGNGMYDPRTGWGELRNPPADARAVAEILRDDLRFDQVIERQNLDRAGMEEALGIFRQALSPADTAFFFYSGHGAQAYDQNYLTLLSE